MYIARFDSSANNGQNIWPQTLTKYKTTQNADVFCINISNNYFIKYTCDSLELYILVTDTHNIFIGLYDLDLCNQQKKPFIFYFFFIYIHFMFSIYFK